MAVPTVMSDLSVTAASNSPAGSESPTSGDDFLRALGAIIRTTNAKGSDIASATTTDIGAATAEFVDVTGTTTITGLGTIAAGIRRTVRFTGALTLTHNATSLILPGGANITTAANDRAEFRSLGSGNWICISYQKADGSSPVGNIKATTTGTATALVLTPLVPIPSYALMPIISAQFHASNGAVATTMNISGKGVLSVKQLNGLGAKIDPVIIAGQISDLAYDGTDLILLDSLPQASNFILNRNAIQYGPLDANNQAAVIPQSQVGNTNANGVTLIAPFFASSANGFNADGTPNNYNRLRTSNLQVPNLTNSANLWIWYDPNTDTAGFTPYVAGSIFQYGGTIPVTANRYTYDYLNHKMYLGNGAAAVAVDRVLVAVVATTPTNVGAITKSFGDTAGLITPGATCQPYEAMFKNQIVEADATRTLSGVSQDWVIPSWARRINITFETMSTNGSSDIIMQIGDSGGIENSGYLGSGAALGAAALFTTGFIVTPSTAATSVFHGSMTLMLHDLATNKWVSSIIYSRSDSGAVGFSSMSKALSSAITAIRLTTVGGVNTFDSGTIKVTFEG
jgi:hypothetical protein